MYNQLLGAKLSINTKGKHLPNDRTTRNILGKNTASQFSGMKTFNANNSVFAFNKFSEIESIVKIKHYIQKI